MEFARLSKNILVFYDGTRLLILWTIVHTEIWYRKTRIEIFAVKLPDTEEMSQIVSHSIPNLCGCDISVRLDITNRVVF